MKLCYCVGINDKGIGVCARFEDLMSDHLNDTDPLARATNKLETALESVACGQASTLSIAVVVILKNIDEQLKPILHRKSETFKETEARSKIGEALRQLLPEVGRIGTDLIAIERKYQ